MSEIDPNTGLPALPEGYFWRVKKSGNKYGYVRLMLRHKFWFATEQENRIFVLNGYTKERLLSDTWAVLREFDFAAAKSYVPLLGDYPPKSIADEDDLATIVADLQEG
jgi:hypothetical protein